MLKFPNFPVAEFFNSFPLPVGERVRVRGLKSRGLQKVNTLVLWVITI
jgi:hypothetical protein